VSTPGPIDELLAAVRTRLDEQEVAAALEEGKSVKRNVELLAARLAADQQPADDG